MKKIFFLMALIVASSGAGAQSKGEAQVLAQVRAVHQAVFVAKDSAALERLFAPEVTYGHSSGRLETRGEAISAASRNPSTYTNVAMGPVSVILQGKTAVTRYLLTGTETNREGKVTELKLNVLQVWTKGGKNWKMIARQATKIP